MALLLRAKPKKDSKNRSVMNDMTGFQPITIVAKNYKQALQILADFIEKEEIKDCSDENGRINMTICSVGVVTNHPIDHLVKLGVYQKGVMIHEYVSP